MLKIFGEIKTFDKKEGREAHSHGHVPVGAAVAERAALLLEGDEVPDGDHRVVRHVEVEELYAGEGPVGTQLARRSGEIIRHEKAIWGMEQGEN